MTLAEAVCTYLSGYAGLIALTGQRIYQGLYPENLELADGPVLVFEESDGGEYVEKIGANPTAAAAQYEFQAWATTEASARAVIAQVYAAMEHKTGQIGGASGVTLIDCFADGAPAVRTEMLGPDQFVWLAEFGFKILYYL